MNAASVFFPVSLFIIYITIRNCTILKKTILTFGEYLQLKAFPSYSEFECYKFAVLRILFGLIILSRAINIHSYLISEDFVSSVGMWSFLGLTAAIFLTVGLFTQYSLLFLVFLMWQYGDTVMGTSTLGNDVGAMLAVLLFLTGAGRYLSIDSLMVNRIRWAGKFLLYTNGYPDSKSIALAKFSALTSYWALCVYSLSMHLNESAWMTGVAGPLLMTNNFMSSWYQFFESVFISNELLVHATRILLWLMMLWYLVILPLTLFGGIGRRYVFVWGILFFVFCWSLLNLGSLVEIEFIFWAAIFWSNIGINSSEGLSVFYDDKCNLCDRTVQIISALDIFGRIRVSPISENNETLKKLNIHRNKAMIDLYGLEDRSGEIYFDYDFYIVLSKKIFLLWPLYPVLLLGKLLRIGPILHRSIAIKKHQLLAVSNHSRQKVTSQVQSQFAIPQYFTLSIVVHIIFLAGCFLVSIPAPYLGIVGSVNAASRAAHYYGIAPINVFNRTDLRMAENWFTLKSLDYDELLPVFTEFGERLETHKSDRIYFGNTLRFRRKAIGNKACESAPEMMEYLAKVYLSRKYAPEGAYFFKFNQYYQSLPDSKEIIRGKYIINKRELKCSYEYKVDFKS